MSTHSSIDPPEHPRWQDYYKEQDIVQPCEMPEV